MNKRPFVGPIADAFVMMSGMPEEDAAERFRCDAAAARALWALADLHVPTDVREAAARWGLEHTIVEVWRQAFIAGFRVSQGIESRARKEADNG